MHVPSAPRLRFGNDSLLPVPYGKGPDKKDLPAKVADNKPASVDPKPQVVRPKVIEAEVVDVKGKPVKPPHSRLKRLGLIGGVLAILLGGLGASVLPRFI